jgi:hypothetical protein
VAFGLKDDDWEEHEKDMQAWFQRASDWAFSDEGAIGEAVTRGLPRLVGMDLSGSLGADNLITFGQPKTMDSEGTMAWLFQSLVLGASGNMMWKSIEQLRDGDIAGAIPWPKIIKNLIDAQKLYSEGTVSKETGEEYMPPQSAGEAIVKGLGFRTADEAREWEAGGGGVKSKEKRKTSHARSVLMGRWASADAKERARIVREDIREWNASHKKSRERIDMADLYKSKRTREKRRKELEEED